MKLNGEQVGLLRAAAVRQVRGTLDFARGDARAREVCEGFSPGYGTTCSFLVHWMLARLQVSGENTSLGTTGRKRSLVNRNVPTLGAKLTPGDGISSVANSKAYLRHKQGAKPEPGDCVIIQRDPYHQPHEHIFVFLREIDATTWETGESGQAASKAADGAIDGKLKQRKIRVAGARIFAEPSDGVPERYVHGWLDLSQLDFATTNWG